MAGGKELLAGDALGLHHELGVDGQHNGDVGMGEPAFGIVEAAQDGIEQDAPAEQAGGRLDAGLVKDLEGLGKAALGLPSPGLGPGARRSWPVRAFGFLLLPDPASGRYFFFATWMRSSSLSK